MRPSVERTAYLALAIGVGLLSACGGSDGRRDLDIGGAWWIGRPAVSREAVWVPTRVGFELAGDNSLGCICGVTRVDPRDGGVVGLVDLTSLATSGRLQNPSIGAVAVGAGSLWVGFDQGDVVVRVDATTRLPIAVIDGISRPTAITYGGGSVWVAGDDGIVTRIDPRTNRSVASIGVPEGPTAIVYGFGSVWVTGSRGIYVAYETRYVSRIDPSANTVAASIEVGSHPMDLAIGAGAVWVSLFGDGKIVRIEPTTNKVGSAIAVPTPASLTVARGSIWVAATESNEIVVIDEHALKPHGRLRVRRLPVSVQYADDALWVTYNDVGSVGSTQAPDPSVLSRLPVPRDAR